MYDFHDISKIVIDGFGSHSGAIPAINWDAVPVVALLLLVFGIGYNALIRYLDRHGLNDGYTWLEVVVGVAVTLLAAAFVIGLEATIALLVLFAAAGLLPALGDMWRYSRARQAEARRDDEQ